MKKAKKIEIIANWARGHWGPRRLPFIYQEQIDIQVGDREGRGGARRIAPFGTKVTKKPSVMSNNDEAHKYILEN